MPRKLIKTFDEAVTRIKSEYDIDPNTGCHISRFSKGNDGYAKVWINSKTYKAHKISIMASLGIPFSSYYTFAEVVAHRCNTPACVNAKHLVATTHQVNMLHKAGGTVERAMKEANYRNTLLNTALATYEKRNHTKYYWEKVAETSI